eukprot:scaffold2418_cov175-Amphora_coffeaeformis.AAC.4
MASKYVFKLLFPVFIARRKLGLAAIRCVLGCANVRKRRFGIVGIPIGVNLDMDPVFHRDMLRYGTYYTIGVPAKKQSQCGSNYGTIPYTIPIIATERGVFFSRVNSRGAPAAWGRKMHEKDRSPRRQGQHLPIPHARAGVRRAPERIQQQQRL